MQKSGAPPPLLPLLRSRLQAEVLTLVLLNPDREWTLTELASRVGSAVSSVQREIVRAERAGVVASRRVGKTRLVKAARSPLTAPLTELLLRSFGPRQVLADELADVPGIENAYLFGSWAARYAGQEGRPLLTWMSSSSERLIVTHWMMRLSVRALALPVRSM